jgi:hypothetical protein
VDSSRLFHAWR